MAPTWVDLTSPSPEPEEPLLENAKAILESFEPRKQKEAISKSNILGANHAPAPGNDHTIRGFDKFSASSKYFSAILPAQHLESNRPLGPFGQNARSDQSSKPVVENQNSEATSVGHGKSPHKNEIPTQAEVPRDNGRRTEIVKTNGKEQRFFGENGHESLLPERLPKSTPGHGVPKSGFASKSESGVNKRLKLSEFSPRVPARETQPDAVSSRASSIPIQTFLQASKRPCNDIRTFELERPPITIANMDIQQAEQYRAADGNLLSESSSDTHQDEPRPHDLFSPNEKHSASRNHALPGGIDDTFGQKSTLTQAKNVANGPAKHAQGVANHGLKAKAARGMTPYSAEEDALLVKLKEIDKLKWLEIATYFNGRSIGSLSTRYAVRLAGKSIDSNSFDSHDKRGRPKSGRPAKKSNSPDVSVVPHDAESARPQRSKRGTEQSVADQFISWAEVKKYRMAEKDPKRNEDVVVSPEKTEPTRVAKPTVPRILRQRELGYNGNRKSTSSNGGALNRLKEHITDGLSPYKYFQGTSGDVTSLAWASDGRRFAAGSIAISDDRSMQYNRPYNLLLGDNERSLLQELPEHHLPRPMVVSADYNPNSFYSMRETQDPRLFMTVAAVQFSPDCRTLYTGGGDSKVRAYKIDNCAEASPLYAIHHSAAVDLVSVSNTERLATACRDSSGDSIGVFDGKEKVLGLSPSRSDLQTTRPIYPSALKWGTAWIHSNYLLAGFSLDGYHQDANIAGETCLWDVRNQSRTVFATRNVFDLAWNPRPSRGSTVFAIACSPSLGMINKNKGARSLIQCYAPDQNKAKRVLEWDCPASDINDVLYCPYDDNILAAGSTDGKVYIWDQRFKGRDVESLHVFTHGESLSILPRDRPREVADTGVRFLSWGATASRLYSASSDGVVKIWNPYLSKEDAHVKDVAAFTSAVMSGAFSPDFRELLIGEDQGRINLLSVKAEEITVRIQSAAPAGKVTSAKGIKHQPNQGVMAKRRGPKRSRNPVTESREETLKSPLQRFEIRSAPSTQSPPENTGASAVDLIRTGQIDIRPMGALPVRQAVQGPCYQGPFIAPSEEQLNSAQTLYDNALKERELAQTQIDDDSSSDDEAQSALSKAHERASVAQQKLVDMRSRIIEVPLLREQARAHQQQLKRAEEEQMTLHALLPNNAKCPLDCNFLPKSNEDETGVLDSRRSATRIPGAVRALRQPRADYSKQTLENLILAGFTRKCSRCSAPAKESKNPGLVLCNTCRDRSEGLTASCKKCSAPVRAVDDGVRQGTLCERCNFSCFRCGRPALLSTNASHVTCFDCGLVWRAGVLGYEIVERHFTRVGKKERQRSHSTSTGEDDDTGDELNNIHEYYHTFWGE